MNDSWSSHPAPLRVLLAESSPLVREGLRQILTELIGVQIVAEPASCDELRALFESTEVDLLLLDMGLPGAGIFDALAEYQTTRPEVRVIALSQSRSSALDQRYLDAGADLVLPKTTGLEKLVEAVAAFSRQLPSGS